MALRGTLTHRKTRRLALSLGIDPPEALGLMEALWNVAAEMRRPDGGVGRMSDDDLAMEMHSRREGKVLVEALVRAALLDAVDGADRLVVHDWHEHSDDTTDVKLGRMGARYACGALPRLGRLKVADREAMWARCDPAPAAPAAGASPAVHATESHTMPGNAIPATQSHTMPGKPQTRADVALPEPEPEPARKASTPLPPLQGGEGSGIGAQGSANAAAVRAGPRLVELVLGRTDDGAEAAVGKVQRECGLSNPRMAKVIRAAMDLQHALTDEPPRWNETAERMSAAYAEYLASKAQMQYALGPRRFFSEGLWCDARKWPWDEEKLRMGRSAMVGMRP